MYKKQYNLTQMNTTFPWEGPLGPCGTLVGVVGTHPHLGLSNELKQKYFQSKHYISLKYQIVPL